MKKRFWRLQKQNAILCIVMLLCFSLTTGCTQKSNNSDSTPSANSNIGTEIPDNTQDNLTSDNLADASLVSLRQATVGTPQLFSVAYLGYAEQEPADPLTVMRESSPQLCENLPFLTRIPKENVIGTSGQLYCIIPTDENATVTVNQGVWNTESDAYEYQDVIYRSESGEPILIFCNNSGQEPDTQLTITDSEGSVIVWQLLLDSNGCIAPLCDENGASLFHDFSNNNQLNAMG